MSAQPNPSLSWGRRARRQGLGADNQARPQGGGQERQQAEQNDGTHIHTRHRVETIHREETHHAEESESSVGHNRNERNAEGAVDPMLQQLIELLMQAVGRQPRGTERVGSYTISDFLKLVTAMKNLGTTKFQGEPDPIKADEWIEMVEENFKATLCPTEYKHTIAVYYLEKEAAAWWKSTERQHNESEITWEVFKTEFLRKYFPPEARDRLERKFLTLYQGEGWSVRRYEAEFVKLRRYVYRGVDDETAMMRYFLNGLNAEISSRLSVVDFPNLNRMIECAANVEEKLGLLKGSKGKGGIITANRFGKPKSEYPRQSSSQFSGRGSTRTASQSRFSTQSMNCFRCGKPGHLARDCRTNPTLSQPNDHTENRKRTATEHVTCFMCGEKGHYSNACPNRIARSVVSVNRPQGIAEVEPAAKKKALDNRVYSLTVDEPGPSEVKKGPIAGM